MKARDIMTEYAQVVMPTDPISHAAALMRDSNIGFVPVVDDRESNHLVGVITDRDITISHVASAHETDCPVNQHMTAQGLVTVRPDADVQEVHELMTTHQVRRIPVTDSEGRILGVIALADVAVKAEKPRDAGHLVAEISEPAKPDR
jgi:CBS domain-containing protein